MQLPLAVCQQFGQFAFQDEQKGVEAIAAIQGFMDEYQDVSVSSNESQAKTATIDPTITAAKSVKLLPNMQINLKALIKDTQKLLQEAINLATIGIGGTLTGDLIMGVGAALYFIQFAIGLTTVKLKSEHAGVLVALHHLSGGELRLEFPLSELQAKMRDDDHFSLSVDELDDILEDLVDLHCVGRQQDVIYLMEKVVLKDD